MRSAMRRSSSASMRAAAARRERHGIGARAQVVREAGRRRTRVRRPRRAHCRCRGRSGPARGAAPAHSGRWLRRRFHARRRSRRLCGIIGAWQLSRNICPSHSLCIVGIAGIAACVLWRHPAPAVELTTGTYLPPSRELPDFSLIDQQGRVLWVRESARPLVAACSSAIRIARISARPRSRHWPLCKSVCARTKGPVLPQVIFVSVDAKRDTPAQIDEIRAVLRSRIHRPHRRRSAEHRGRGEKARRRRGHPARIRTATTRSITPVPFSCSLPTGGSVRS